jgi:hypothetical protein
MSLLRLQGYSFQNPVVSLKIICRLLVTFNGYENLFGCVCVLHPEDCQLLTFPPSSCTCTCQCQKYFTLNWKMKKRDGGECCVLFLDFLLFKGTTFTLGCTWISRDVTSRIRPFLLLFVVIFFVPSFFFGNGGLLLIASFFADRLHLATSNCRVQQPRIRSSAASKRLKR